MIPCLIKKYFALTQPVLGVTDTNINHQLSQSIVTMFDTEEREQTWESQTDDAERQRMQEELNEKMLEAARRGKNEDVIQHISDGAEITSKTSRGNTGLHLSAWKGHKDVIETFISKHKIV